VPLGAALSSFTVDELLGPSDFPVIDAAVYPLVRRRAKLIAARMAEPYQVTPEHLR
jgi:hypothetical protein